jgi:adenine-specific DNA-methyltransferase
MTETEQFVWQRLRYRQIDGHKFRRQFPIGPYVVDFIFLEKRLIVELDGGQHAERQEADQTRSDWLNGQRFRVLRFWNHEALEDWDVVERVIWEHLQASTPHPNPPPQGGREPESSARCESQPSRNGNLDGQKQFKCEVEA